MPYQRLLVLLALAAVPLGARDAHAAEDARVAKAIRAHGDIVLDGQLGEADWKKAPNNEGFWKREPVEGGKPDCPTEFRVLFDDSALYVAIRASDPEPGGVRALLTRRDADSASDWVTFALDSYHDKRTAFVFSVNAAGVQRDMMIYEDTSTDESWDAVWDSAVATDEQGWTAELKIPFSQLRFSSEEQMTWGVQVERFVSRTNERSVFSPWPKESSQRVSLFGELEGLSGITPPQRIELRPFLLGGLRLTPGAAGSIDGSAGPLANGGLDARIGLSSDLTLTATFNPDFGQVEADPSQVNLTDKELFFAERRPFFVEGSDILHFSLGQGDGDGSVQSLFYSRRIGAAPHGNPSSYDASSPQTTAILGAAKLSGKIDGWSIGAQSAVTSKEEAQLRDADGAMSSQIVEPLTHYGVARIQRDFRDGASSIGAAITSVHRALGGTELDWLHRSALTGGIEATHRFGDAHYLAQLRLAASEVRGSTQAIDRTQRSSVHNYQRPDADHLRYDPTRESLSGMMMQWMVGKVAGGHWRFSNGGDIRTAGLEVNDLGFQTDADTAVLWGWGQYREDEVDGPVRDYGINANVWSAWNTAPELAGSGGNMNGWFNLDNNWGGNLGASLNNNLLSFGALRGGPALAGDPSLSAWGGMWSDSRRAVRANLNISAGTTPASGSRAFGISSLASVQAASNLELSLGPNVRVDRSDDQYIGEAEAPDGTPRYILGRVDERTLGMTVRASFTFTPKLSLQLYAEPFLATGRYSRHKEVADSRAGDRKARFHEYAAGELVETESELAIDRDMDGVVDYQVARPDFSLGQLRSNLVLRWEYLPGSRLFAIWSHGRSSYTSDGVFRLGSDASELANQDGEHIVLIKLDYWYGR